MFGIFWDCDGTIMDTEKSYAYAWKDFLHSKGLDLPIEDFDKFVGVDDRLVHQQFSNLVDLDTFESTMDELHKIMRVDFSEKILFNEKTATETASIIEVLQYTTDDIKMVYQDTTGDGTGVPKFAADTKLYNRILTGFSGSDQLNVINNSASVNNRNFAGVGIKTDTIIAFNNGAGNDPHFNRITDISGDGKTLTLSAVTSSVSGINNGNVLSGISTSSTFRTVSYTHLRAHET